ncbi:Uncharacterised protein [uncultured archaeon]|nr:Uncharacterised protein [uncultured archaeon]
MPQEKQSNLDRTFGMTLDEIASMYATHDVVENKDTVDDLSNKILDTIDKFMTAQGGNIHIGYVGMALSQVLYLFTEDTLNHIDEVKNAENSRKTGNVSA